ncbi:CDP-diacylglycerol--serine O-phosphatidyltransferase [Thioalkalivibrio sulfidiphilus]|uniref:CDP-diacylglycerol--serine O-phosphatidyltransferase n=1 Tax=Thioalkalivibrio sulfidiphilus (strain HL-EbGR7) TaxID=396588 RepID=B8GUB4_THISH|nr:CDP-diacylglycerol--serine O-phosphatidyltransferase [Thioalkalivibrio sulfidiphilus]ACL73234.1 CDP-diacylglycerol--serine O-phosphatidyltransferase [Thioalkalivibrio sulfidiphilus HL-EbGr7]
MSDTEPQAGDQKARRGIYLLPNLFTTAALFAGFYAIVAAINDQFTAAAIAVFVAMVLDGIDGRVARMTNTQSAFGAEYDSLSDMVSFGLAPALVVYLWALVELGQVGWVAAFFYAAAAALRLARFNTKVGVADKRFFQGLPSPSAAALVMGMVWVWHDLEFVGTDLGIMALVVTVIAGALMVSNVTYFSFKDMDFRHRVPFFVVLVIVVALMLTAIDPPKVLWGGFLLYALSGPTLTVIRWRRRRARGSEDKADGEEQKED